LIPNTKYNNNADDYDDDDDDNDDDDYDVDTCNKNADQSELGLTRYCLFYFTLQIVSLTFD